MGRPAGGYFAKDGGRVPSVTTVSGMLKDADRLMYWAWQQGKDGKDFRETKQAAADAGTLVHAAVESWVRGKPFTWPTRPKAVVTGARTGYSAFLEWAQQTRLKVTHPEVSLISEKYRVGGTFDALMLGKKRAMGDWKTSGGVYPNYLIQIAAYGKLWEEHHPGEPIDGGYILVRFDRLHGDFHYSWWANLDDAWETFLLLRKVHDLEKKLRERVK